MCNPDQSSGRRKLTDFSSKLRQDVEKSVVPDADHDGENNPLSAQLWLGSRAHYLPTAARTTGATLVANSSITRATSTNGRPPMSI
jgi:hypothetical protein